MKIAKQEIIKEKEDRYSNNLNLFQNNLPEKSKKLLNINTKKSLLNCLTALRITEFESELSNQQFWD